MEAPSVDSLYSYAQVHFAQYTFSLFATDAGRTALRFYPDDVPPQHFYDDPSGGGMRPSLVLHVILASTTVLMATIA